MPSTQQLLYRSERIATEPGLPGLLGLVNVVGERTPHFAFRRGTFSRIESTMELARIIETWGHSSCSSPIEGEGQPHRKDSDILFIYILLHRSVIIFCVYIIHKPSDLYNTRDNSTTAQKFEIVESWPN